MNRTKLSNRYLFEAAQHCTSMTLASIALLATFFASGAVAFALNSDETHEETSNLRLGDRLVHYISNPDNKIVVTTQTHLAPRSDGNPSDKYAMMTSANIEFPYHTIDLSSSIRDMTARINQGLNNELVITEFVSNPYLGDGHTFHDSDGQEISLDIHVMTYEEALKIFKVLHPPMYSYLSGLQRLFLENAGDATLPTIAAVEKIPNGVHAKEIVNLSDQPTDIVPFLIGRSLKEQIRSNSGIRNAIIEGTRGKRMLLESMLATTISTLRSPEVGIKARATQYERSINNNATMVAAEKAAPDQRRGNVSREFFQKPPLKR